MNRSTLIAVTAVFVAVVAAQARRIHIRGNAIAALRLSLVASRDRCAELDRMYAEATAENKVIRDENVKLLNARFQGSPS